MARTAFTAAGTVIILLGTAASQAPPRPLAAADYVELETAYARSMHEASRQGVRHWITNLAVEAAPGGAHGWAYIAQARGIDLLSAALYRDAWVKTAGGWRLKDRRILPGTMMPPRVHYPPRPNTASRVFTPRDYFEIKNVWTRYNVGYDNAAPFDGGVLSGLSFTKDA